MAWNRSNDDSAEKRSPDRFRNKGGRRSKEATGVSLPRCEAGGRPLPRSPWLRGAIAALIVVVGAGIAAWMLWPKEEARRDAAPAKKMLIREVTPAKLGEAPRPQESVAPVASEEPQEKWQDSFIDDPKKRLKFSTLFEARTNTDGIVVERFRLPNGKTWRRIVDPPPTFENMAESAIATVISGNAGAPIPPVPGLDDANLDQAFANAMASPIRIKETDSPQLVALKMAVQETKQEIARMIKEGDTRSVGEILQDHINLSNRNSDMRADAIKAVHKVREEMGEEAARDYLEKVNESLARYGVDPVSIGTGRGRRESESNANTEER